MSTFFNLHDLAPWSRQLQNLYYHLRAERRLSHRRRYWYRRISVEKDRLYALGVDRSLVRLMCRHFANPDWSGPSSRLYDRLFSSSRAA